MGTVRNLSLLLAVLALFGAQAGLSIQLRNLDTVWVGPHQEQGARKWDPRLFRILSFGHLPAAIDWKWIGILIDPSLTRLPRGVHPPLYYELDLVTDLDPGFFEAYYTGAGLLSVIRDDGIGARDILLKAETYRKEVLPSADARFARTYWSGGWWLTLNLAYVYLFELQDLPQAAEAFREAARQPGSPAYLRSLAERLERPGGQYEVGIRLLNFLIESTPEPKLRARYEEQRRSLFVSQYVSDLTRSFRGYLEHHPRYRPGLPLGEVSRFWASYRQETGLAALDPWGGRLTVDAVGKVGTTTPHQPVFGLE